MSDKSTPTRPRTDYEEQQVEVLANRLRLWSEALQGFDKEDIATKTAAVAALVVHVGDIAGAQGVMSGLFARLKRYDERWRKHAEES